MDEEIPQARKVARCGGDAREETHRGGGGACPLRGLCAPLARPLRAPCALLGAREEPPGESSPTPGLPRRAGGHRGRGGGGPRPVSSPPQQLDGEGGEVSALRFPTGKTLPPPKRGVAPVFPFAE